MRRRRSFALLLALAGCTSGASDMREWRPSDHDVGKTAPGQAPMRAGASAQAAEAGLVDLAWQRNCSRCHGPRGRGDGPDGASVGAFDLTSPAWQSAVTDEEILSSIWKGKGKMPGFEGSIPLPLVQGLVKRIRSSRGEPSADGSSRRPDP